MKCDCGAEMRISHERHHYLESGLPGVWLEDIETRRCPKCDELEIVIPRLDALHRMLARALVAKRDRLTGVEVRFLRKSIGWAGVDLARHIGVDKASVSRWENDKEPIGLQSDRLLRAYVVMSEPNGDYCIDQLAEVGEHTGEAVGVCMTLVEGVWQAVAAA